MVGKMIITHGLQGSGKSTWAEEQFKNDPQNVLIVERDALRTKLFGEKYHKRTPDKRSEAQVNQIQETLIRDGLTSGKTVIVSDTNLNPRTVGGLVNKAKQYGATVEQHYFDVSLEECKRRNKSRAERGGRMVPEEVMEAMAAKAYDDEGKLKEFIVSKNGVFMVSRNTPGMKILQAFNERLLKKNPLLGKSVVLVDVDGTLANNAQDAAYFLSNPDNRKKDFPGFYKAIKSAQVNSQVRDLANQMRDEDKLNLMVLTGRDDSYIKELLDFIERSKLKASRVIAKRNGDFRPDGEYKQEMIHNLREEGLVVVHAFDDRESSIRTMENEGILVSRVDTPKIKITSHMGKPPAPAPEPKVNTIYGSGYCIRCGSPLKSGENIGPVCRTK